MLGPEAQRAALLRWAEVRGLQLVAVHEDRGVSGAAPLDRRPGLLAALDSLVRLVAALGPATARSMKSARFALHEFQILIRGGS